jgi:hypothetical protein
MGSSRQQALACYAAVIKQQGLYQCVYTQATWWLCTTAAEGALYIIIPGG